MEKDHRVLPLHVGILDPEVESILVRRPLKTELSRLGNGFFRRNVVIKLDEDDLTRLSPVEVPRREVLGGHARVGVRVLARLHEFLGRSAVSGRDPVAPGAPPRGHSVGPA